MPTERKVQLVADLEERLNRTVMAIGLDYRGLSVAQMRALRTALRDQEASMELRVVKNTLLKRAAENAGKPQVIELANESTALVLGYGEEVAPPKALKKYLSESRLTIPVHAGYLDGEVLTAAQVDDLATVPSRPELMAKLAGGLNGPIGGIAGGLNALLRQLAAIIDARAEQLAADAPEVSEETTQEEETTAGAPEESPSDSAPVKDDPQDTADPDNDGVPAPESDVADHDTTDAVLRDDAETDTESSDE